MKPKACCISPQRDTDQQQRLLHPFTLTDQCSRQKRPFLLPLLSDLSPCLEGFPPIPPPDANKTIQAFDKLTPNAIRTVWLSWGEKETVSSPYQSNLGGGQWAEKWPIPPVQDPEPRQQARGGAISGINVPTVFFARAAVQSTVSWTA